jgi:hypothetical protein
MNLELIEGSNDALIEQAEYDKYTQDNTEAWLDTKLQAIQKPE